MSSLTRIFLRCAAVSTVLLQAGSAAAITPGQLATVRSAPKRRAEMFPATERGRNR